MIKISDWLIMILSGLEDFINPLGGYMIYKEQEMKKYYSNFLDCSYTYLYEDCLLEEIEAYQTPFNILKSLLSKLLNFRKILIEFYEQFYEVDDSTLLTSTEWEKIKPLALECYQELDKIRLKLKGEASRNQNT